MPQMTITTTGPQAARLAAAVGRKLNLMDEQDPPQPRSATAAEVKQYTIQFLRSTVFDVERRDAEQAAAATVDNIEPT